MSKQQKQQQSFSDRSRAVSPFLADLKGETMQHTAPPTFHDILIFCDNPPRKQNVAAQIFKEYAVHRQTPGLINIFGDGWTVTHVVSGVSIWPVQQRQAAISCAFWLECYSVLPAKINKEELFRWAEENAEAWSVVIDQLTQIAPRWKGANA
jgi:hypothetical protein